MSTLLDEINKQVQTDEVDPNAMEKMGAIAQEADKQIKQCVSDKKPEDYEGHLYPVLFVQECTQHLKDVNTQISYFIVMLQEATLGHPDPYWLKNRIQKFVDWINDKLKKLRQKIVNGLKGMYKQVKKVMQLLDPIVNVSISLDTVVSWAQSVISFFAEPYEKVVTFIVDFMSYTPPLVQETTTTATLVAATATQIQPTVEKLEGEGMDIIKEQIMTALGTIKFDPISMGDVTGG